MTTALATIGALYLLREASRLFYAAFLKDYGPTLNDIMRRVPAKGSIVTRPDRGSDQ